MTYKDNTDIPPEDCTQQLEIPPLKQLYNRLNKLLLASQLFTKNQTVDISWYFPSYCGPILCGIMVMVTGVTQKCIQYRIHRVTTKSTSDQSQ